MDAKDLLEKYRQDRHQLIFDLRVLNSTIRKIEADLEEGTQETEHIDAFFTDKREEKPGRSVEITPGEFLGKSHGDAARSYLERLGVALSLDQILDVLKRGGCKVGGVNPKRTLYISLVRNTKDFVLVPPDGFIGLRKFYPDLKTQKTVSAKSSEKKVGKAAKAKSKPSDKRNKKKKVPRPSKTVSSKHVTKTQDEKTKPKQTIKADTKGAKGISSTVSEKPTTVIIRNALKGGHTKTLQDLLKIVNEKSGKNIPKIAVLSVLKTKEFAEAKSRLLQSSENAP